MKRPALFARRSLWLPTGWGWLLIAAVASSLATGIALNAVDFYSASRPARGVDGGGARTLVVEGWMNEQGLAQAVLAAQRGRYDRVVATGGPIEPWIDAGGWGTFARRAGDYLQRHDLGGARLVEVPAPDTLQDRTYLNALMVRAWAARSGTVLGAVDLYSYGVHARRSRLLYRMALGDLAEVGVRAAVPEQAHADRWWASSTTAKALLGEAIGHAWTVCCFWPGDPADAAAHAAAGVAPAESAAPVPR